MEFHYGSSIHLIGLGKYTLVNIGVSYNRGQDIEHMKLQNKKILA